VSRDVFLGPAVYMRVLPTELLSLARCANNQRLLCCAGGGGADRTLHLLRWRVARRSEADACCWLRTPPVRSRTWHGHRPFLLIAVGRNTDAQPGVARRGGAQAAALRQQQGVVESAVHNPRGAR
jgi:hypothetical protein